jgi:hypothetical protein
MTTPHAVDKILREQEEVVARDFLCRNDIDAFGAPENGRRWVRSQVAVLRELRAQYPRNLATPWPPTPRPVTVGAAGLAEFAAKVQS